MLAIPDTHPLLLPNLVKAQTSNDLYLRGSIQLVDGYGEKGQKPRPYKQDQAVKALQSWVYRAAMLNAMAFSAVPLKLYVRKRGRGQKLYRTRPVSKRQARYLCGDAEQKPSARVLRKVAEIGADFEEVTEPHPALTVLSKVNGWQNGFELSLLRCLYWQVTGNSYLHPVIDPALGIPAELYLLPSQWTAIIPNKARIGESLVSGYVYGRRPDQVTFAADEVIHWRLPNLADQYYGMGWMEALWTALGLHISKRTNDTAKYDNFCRPDWMLVVKSGATSTNLDRVEAQIESKLRGQRKAGRFLAVSGDVEAVPLNFDDPDIGDPDKIIEEIASVSGVPLHKLRGNDPVKANSETQDTGWLRDTILPYCRMDEEVLNAEYLPLFDEQLEGEAVLAYDNPVPQNKVQDVEIAVKRVGGAYVSVNEQREEEGLEPIEGGDVLRADKPGGKVDDEEAAQPAAQQIQTTQDTVLAGGQVTAAIDIVAQVTAGTLPRDAGVAMLEAFFNLKPEAAERIMGTAGTKKPTVANPNPAQEQRDEQEAELARERLAGMGRGGGTGGKPSKAVDEDEKTPPDRQIEMELFTPPPEVKAAAMLALDMLNSEILHKSFAPGTKTASMPPINITMPELNPVIQVNVPDVTVPAPNIVVQAPQVTVENKLDLPEREMTIRRDENGRIEGAAIRDA